MRRYKTLFLTERGQRHQQHALQVAPPELDIVLLRQPDRATLWPYLAEAEYLISERAGLIDSAMIQAGPRLKLILRLGSLVYDIDTEAARQAGVIVCYWPIGSVIRVAEHAIMQLLVLGKHLRASETIALAAGTEWGESRRTDEDTYAYNWSDRRLIDSLWQKQVGILGFGEIGVELTRRLQGWDCTLLYHKRRRLPEPLEAELGLAYGDLEALCASSDYLVNLLPYSKKSDLLLNAEFFKAMKRGAYFASCGSGSVVDEAALARAVESGHLAGAALDTFEWEPLRADHPLLALAKAGHNVLLTPHVAAGPRALSAAERRRDYSTIVNHIEGRPLKYRVV